jgi:nucleoside-diphosphate-sugar epimerase
MKIKNVKITGENGFLMKHLLPHLTFPFKENTLIHFAFPSDSEDFKNIENMRNILKYSIKLFDEAMKNGDRIIFASSEAVLEDESWYACNKKVLEYYIKDYENKLILRIPRVYGKNRNKGLIKKLKNNTYVGDKNKIIEFMDINDWINETLNIIGYNITYRYKNKQRKTVKEIKERYAN